MPGDWLHGGQACRCYIKVPTHQRLLVIQRHPRVEIHAEGARHRRDRGEHEHHAVNHEVQRDNLVPPAAVHNTAAVGFMKTCDEAIHQVLILCR